MRGLGWFSCHHFPSGHSLLEQEAWLGRGGGISVSTLCSSKILYIFFTNENSNAFTEYIRDLHTKSICEKLVLLLIS